MTRQLLIGTMLLGIAACNRASHEEAEDLMSIVRSTETAHQATDTTQMMLSSAAFLEGVEYEAAVGFNEVAPFSVARRTPEIERYPCSQCHDVSLNRMTRNSEERAHWELEMNHAAEDVMQCTTCHSAANMDSLVTFGGTEVGIDRAYRVCQQCHSAQVEDWAGGAHGKRIGGWAPPRVATNCASCHNPHDPAFGTRWPARPGREGGSR